MKDLKGKAWLGIIDADSILYRVAAACEDEDIEKAKDSLRGFIYSSVYAPTLCQQYVFCLSGGESGRKEVAVTKPYKGQRSKDKPRHLKPLREYLTEEYKAFVVDNLEADDVVIAIYEKYRGYSLLMGIDKDAKQLAGAHYNYVKQTFDLISDRDSQRYFFTQMLTGDNVDNIPGVPRVGAKGAEKLFAENPDTPPAKLVWDLYKEKGLDWDYYQEQYYLLRMKRDIIYPFEEHFVDLKPQPAELLAELLDEEF
jgi:hypothetical protein